MTEDFAHFLGCEEIHDRLQFLFLRLLAQHENRADDGSILRPHRDHRSVALDHLREKIRHDGHSRLFLLRSRLHHFRRVHGLHQRLTKFSHPIHAIGLVDVQQDGIEEVEITHRQADAVVELTTQERFPSEGNLASVKGILIDKENCRNRSDDGIVCIRILQRNIVVFKILVVMLVVGDIFKHLSFFR